MLVEFLPLEELHQEVHVRFIFKKVVQRNDVLVLQLAMHVDLLLDAVGQVLRPKVLFVDYLKGVLLTCLSARHSVDKGCGPTAQLAHDLIVRQGAAKSVHFKF